MKIQMMIMNRRAALGLGAAGLVGGVASFSSVGHASQGKFQVAYSDAEWRKRLPPKVYAVLRKEDTEPAGTSPLLKGKASRHLSMRRLCAAGLLLHHEV
jgi:hypothetical protein